MDNNESTTISVVGTVSKEPYHLKSGDITYTVSSRQISRYIDNSPQYHFQSYTIYQSSIFPVPTLNQALIIKGTPALVNQFSKSKNRWYPKIVVNRL